MGRKKRKVAEDVEAVPVPAAGGPPPPPQNLGLPPPPPPPKGGAQQQQPAVIEESSEVKDISKQQQQASSAYAMTTHSADIIDEDVYISDGSEDIEEENEIEMVLVGSRMGIMRRGIHHPMLVQPNRQWVRQDQKSTEEGGGEEDEEAEQKRLKEQEEELAKLDPAQRAARLLVEKQRKLDEAKETARRLESEENAGRDPCLFSKRTAFDIRFDQIDDKPWTRGAGDMTDFFNYGLTEEDWMDYAQHQLMIRQELTDASRQRRPVDPTLVPVTPKAPNKQTPKVAVADADDLEENGSETPDANNTESGPVVGPVGPVLVKREDVKPAKEKSEGPHNENKKFVDVHVGSGGAWGAGAAPGSLLAKLIEEQERQPEAKKADSNIGDTSRGQANMDVDSKYGHGTSHDASHDNQGWNNQDSQTQGDQDWNNQNQGHQSHHGDWNNQSHGGQQDWNNRGSYGQQQWNQNQNQHHNNHRGGGGGGRGYHGGRGGRGGRGGYNNDYGQGRDRSHQSYHGGGGGDYQQRKRPRDDYDNRRY